MVAFKAAQLVSFLKSPGPRFKAALFYGPDPAMVADHAATLANTIAAGSDPAGEIIRIDDRDFAESPGRLAVEAQTRSMFAENKVICVAAGARFPTDDTEALLAGPLDAWLIVEAGNLRPTAKLRKIFEASDQAAALPCYELTARDMASFIDAELAARDVSIAPEAKQHLMALFGGDQARARSEITKLALYAGPGHRIGLDDVEAIVGDVAQAALDTLCVAVGDRKAANALRQLDRLVATGQGAQGAIAALGRHFERLHKVCAAVENGEPMRNALGGFRPPLHFRQRDALEAQSRTWSRPRAARALDRVAQAAQAARRTPGLERQFAERLLIVLSQ